MKVVPTTERPDYSPVSTPSPRPAPEPAPNQRAQQPQTMASTVLETAPVSTIVTVDTAAAQALIEAFDDIPDNGSSSLSELGDASDDQSEEPTPRPSVAAMDEDDSEAETERLEQTPRKLTRTATETSLADDATYTRTPSKLIHSKTVDEDDSAPATPSITADDGAITESVDASNPLHSLSLIAASEAASLEHAGKKRKRTSAEDSLVEEQEDGPARKRTTSRTPNGLAAEGDSTEQVDAEEELDNAEERLLQLAHEEIDLEERQANIATETVEELATVAKHIKPRKGGRRGKRKAEDTSYAYGDHLAGADGPDGDGEEENEEENTAGQDEEVAKKKNAIDELAKIEKKFKLFREK